MDRKELRKLLDELGADGVAEEVAEQVAETFESFRGNSYMFKRSWF